VNYRALNKAPAKNQYPLTLILDILRRTAGMPITYSESRKVTSTKPRYRHRVLPFRLTNTPATILPSYNTNLRRYVIGEATTFKERDNPTGDDRMKDQSTLNNRKVQRDPESRISMPREE